MQVSGITDSIVNYDLFNGFLISFDFATTNNASLNYKSENDPDGVELNRWSWVNGALSKIVNTQ